MSIIYDSFRELSFGRILMMMRPAIKDNWDHLGTNLAETPI